MRQDVLDFGRIDILAARQQIATPLAAPIEIELANARRDDLGERCLNQLYLSAISPCCESFVLERDRLRWKHLCFHLKRESPSIL